MDWESVTSDDITKWLEEGDEYAIRGYWRLCNQKERDICTIVRETVAHSSLEQIILNSTQREHMYLARANLSFCVMLMKVFELARELGKNESVILTVT